MDKIESKLEKLQLQLEHLELKIHRKIIEKENEKELSLTHTNRN
jgi:hypothetical protein